MAFWLTKMDHLFKTEICRIRFAYSINLATNSYTLSSCYLFPAVERASPGRVNSTLKQRELEICDIIFANV